MSEGSAIIAIQICKTTTTKKKENLLHVGQKFNTTVVLIFSCNKEDGGKGSLSTKES